MRTRVKKVTKFCSRCGDEIEEDKTNEGIKTKNKSGILKKSTVFVVAVFAIVLIISIFSVRTENEYIIDVKNGSFNSYPEILIGDAFDGFFINTQWGRFVSEDGENIVEFTNGRVRWSKSKNFNTIYDR